MWGVKVRSPVARGTRATISGSGQFWPRLNHGMNRRNSQPPFAFRATERARRPFPFKKLTTIASHILPTGNLVPVKVN